MPLEQLLSLYGYLQPTSATVENPTGTKSQISDSGTNQSHINQSNSGSNSRSRRRRKVVSLEPQKEVSPKAVDTHDYHHKNETSELIRIGIGLVEDAISQTGTNKDIHLEAQTVKNDASNRNTRVGIKHNEMKPDKDTMGGLGGTHREKTGEKRVELVLDDKVPVIDTDVEVDVVEVDEEMGMRLVKDEEALKLDELAMTELNIVKMDDIEAGLSKNEATLRLSDDEEGHGIAVLMTGMDTRQPQEVGLNKRTEGVELSRRNEALRPGFDEWAGLSRRNEALEPDSGEWVGQSELDSNEEVELNRRPLSTLKLDVEERTKLTRKKLSSDERHWVGLNRSALKLDSDKEAGLDSEEGVELDDRGNAVYDDVMLSSCSTRLLSDSGGKQIVCVDFFAYVELLDFIISHRN